LRNAGLLRVALDDVPESLARHAVAAARREQIFGLPLQQDLEPRPAHELLQPADGFLAERDQALAVALADDAQHALIHVDLARLEVHQLRHAQASGVQHFEHRAVAIAERIVDLRRGEQRLDFLFGERLRQRAADLRHRDLRGRIFLDRALADQITVIAAEAGQLARRRARPRAGFDAKSDECEYVCALGGETGAAAALQPAV